MTKKWLRSALDQLCDHDIKFARHWLNLSGGGKHFVIFAWLANTRLSKHPAEPAVLAEALRTWPRKQVLENLVGPIPPGFVNGFEKMNGPVFSQQRYLEFWELYHENNARKAFQHLQSISEFQIGVLLELEPVYRRYSIVRAIEDRAFMSTIQLAIQIVRSQRPDLTDFEISQSLGTSLNADGKISDWLSRALNKVEFPSPPWAGTDRLKPLTDQKQVAACAEQFNNCLVDEINSVLSGQRYFYHWTRGRGAIVAFEKDGFLGWVVGEIKGKKNCSVPQKVLKRIELDTKLSGYRMLKYYDLACDNLWGYGRFL